MESILVIGHRNPDTDAIASAMGYAWLLNQLGSGQYVAGRAGEVNAQTSYALKRFNLEAPSLIVDIWSHVRDLVEPLPSLHKGQTVLDACQSIAKTRRPAPVLDNSRPIGMVTGAGLFSKLADSLSSASVLALARDLDRAVEAVLDAPDTILGGDERVRDVIGQALRSDQDEFLVVDANGNYMGVCRKSGLLAPPHRKLVMVDHNEQVQAVPGLEDAELVEVLDHHRLGNVPTVAPIRFRVDIVGSCSTLVAERIFDEKVTLVPEIAGMLLCGILSDTLVFRSPTTTNRDRRAAEELSKIAGLEGKISELGESLLAAGAGIGSRSATDVVGTDLKFFEAGGYSIAIAQVEVTNFGELEPRIDALRDELHRLSEERRLALGMLMVTDVVRGNSRLVAVGQPRLIAALPYARLGEDMLDAPGVVSRKKQLLPAVLAAVERVA